MEQLMDFLEEKGFKYSEHGVDVIRVVVGEVSFVGYEMRSGELSIVVGNNYAYVKPSDKSEPKLFTSEQFDSIYPYLQSIRTLM